MPNNITKDQIKAALELLRIMGSVIQAAGDIPSGVLYATVMRYVDLQGYERAIDTLVKSGLVQRLPNHMLTWVGPEKQTATKP